MDGLRQRRSRSGVFLGKDGFITPRDLLRWAGRGASSKLELAQEGYMLLAERLRTDEEKLCVKEEIEKHLKVTMDLGSLYFGKDSEARRILRQLASTDFTGDEGRFLSTIAPTKSLLRLVTLVLRCVKQKESVLLVGDTGTCGKCRQTQEKPSSNHHHFVATVLTLVSFSFLTRISQVVGRQSRCSCYRKSFSRPSTLSIAIRLLRHPTFLEVFDLSEEEVLSQPKCFLLYGSCFVGGP